MTNVERRVKTPWWVATTSPVVAGIVPALWALFLLVNVTLGGEWDAARIVAVVCAAVAGLVYVPSMVYIARNR